MKQGYSFPPPFHDVSALISSFMKLRSDLSERPESMLRSIQAALTHFFAAAWDSNPFDADFKNFVTALIKVRTKHASGRTKVMPIKRITDLFCKWSENHELSIKHLRQKTIALLSLSMMARPSDLAPAMGFHRNQMRFSEDNSVVITLCGIKNDSDRHGFEIKIDKASNPKVDPVACLKNYQDRTAGYTSKSSIVNDYTLQQHQRPVLIFPLNRTDFFIFVEKFTLP